MLTYKELAGKYGVGITGGIATGKSTVSSILSAAGCKVYDADKFARLAVNSDTLAKIHKVFGDSIIGSNGCLQRHKLRTEAFANPSKRKALENIMHPQILKLLMENLKKDGLYHSPSLWFYDAALLIETGSYRDFRSVWLTHCQLATQVSRLLARKLTQEEALLVIKSQLSYEEKRGYADFSINTDAPVTKTKTKVLARLQLELKR